MKHKCLSPSCHPVHHGWILLFYPQHCPKWMCTCMHAGETVRCRFQASVPSWTSLLYFGCSVEWLRATIHWFNLGKEIEVSSAVILDVFWAAVVVTLKLLALVSATEYKNFCTCPYFALLFFWTTFSLKVLSVYLYFLELMNVISFFSITVRCWKRAWLMSLSFTF